MESQASFYQAAKMWLAEYLPVDQDILHVLIGVALVAIAALAARGPVGNGAFFRALAVACVLGVGMEILDMRDDIRTFGSWRIGASALDFFRTICAPLVAVITVSWHRKRRS